MFCVKNHIIAALKSIQFTLLFTKFAHYFSKTKDLPIWNIENLITSIKIVGYSAFSLVAKVS